MSALIAYLARAAREAPDLAVGDARGRTDAARARPTAPGTAGETLFLLAERDGALVGCLTFVGGTRPRTRHAGELGVSVAREARGRGVGRALVETLLAWAAAGGVVRTIRLRVRADNARAVALYERLGFAREGRVARERLVDGQLHDCLLMRRPVDRQPSARRPGSLHRR